MSNNRTIRPTMSFCELAVVTATCPRAVGNRDGITSQLPNVAINKAVHRET